AEEHHREHDDAEREHPAPGRYLIQPERGPRQRREQPDGADDRPARAVRDVVVVVSIGMRGHSVSSNIMYDNDTVSWCAGSSDATMNCSVMSRPSPGPKVWLVKQKHST